MSEVIRHRPWGDSVPIEFVTASDYDQLKAENERLASAIRYEQHLADRIGTHGPDCWSWGNAHYECLKRKHQQDVGESILERDTLRKQLDEARELLEKYGYATGDADGRVDAWLKVNK